MSTFAQLLETEIPRLRRYARVLTRDGSRVDDLVQNCLLRAVTKRHLWQAGTDLRAWLFAMLHNQNVNDVRRSAREGVAVPVEDVAGVLAASSNVEALLQLRDLEQAIASLPEQQRQVIRLVGLEDRGYEEVAEILGIPVGTVRSRLSRGRATLRVLIDGRAPQHRRRPPNASRRRGRRRRLPRSIGPRFGLSPTLGPSRPAEQRQSRKQRPPTNAF